MQALFFFFLDPEANSRRKWKKMVEDVVTGMIRLDPVSADVANGLIGAVSEADDLIEDKFRILYVGDEERDVIRTVYELFNARFRDMKFEMRPASAILDRDPILLAVADRLRTKSRKMQVRMLVSEIREWAEEKVFDTQDFLQEFPEETPPFPSLELSEDSLQSLLLPEDVSSLAEEERKEEEIPRDEYDSEVEDAQDPDPQAYVSAGETEHFLRERKKRKMEETAEEVTKSEEENPFGSGGSVIGQEIPEDDDGLFTVEPLAEADEATSKLGDPVFQDAPGSGLTASTPNEQVALPRFQGACGRPIYAMGKSRGTPRLRQRVGRAELPIPQSHEHSAPGTATGSRQMGDYGAEVPTIQSFSSSTHSEGGMRFGHSSGMGGFGGHAIQHRIQVGMLRWSMALGFSKGALTTRLCVVHKLLT